jgi:hypothetical protein
LLGFNKVAVKPLDSIEYLHPPLNEQVSPVLDDVTTRSFLIEFPDAI